MTWRTECKSAIAAAILSWPFDICRIVADYALNDVRWSAYQDRCVKVSADGRQASIQNDDESTVTCRCFEGTSYWRLIAEQPLRETSTSWHLRFSRSDTNNWFVFQFGVLPHGKVDETARLSPRLYIDSASIDFYESRKPVAADCNDIRFTVDADLDGGVVNIRISADGSTTLWHSTVVPSAVLRMSFPVVYFFGNGTTVRLIGL